MNFSETVKAQLAGQKVQMDVLVEFDFLSSTQRLWNGFGDLVTSDSKTWSGIAGLGKVSGLQQSFDGQANPLNLTVSGLDANFAATIQADKAEYYYRTVTVYMQFFNEDWSVLDAPYAINLSRIVTMKASMVQGNDNSHTHVINMTAESPFVSRRRPPFGFLTDADQQARFPGDLGCARVAGIDKKIVSFPDY